MVAEAGLEATTRCGGLLCLCDEHLRQSVLRISPFAVPEKSFGLTHFLAFFDRGTHCALASSAAGSAQARDPTSYAYHSHNPEVTPDLLHKQRKEKSHPVWDDFFFSGKLHRKRYRLKTFALNDRSRVSTANYSTVIVESALFP